MPIQRLEEQLLDMLRYFICHASEDKDQIARPLATAMIARNLRVWYDEYSLTLGDGLRRSIEKGLSDSDFAVVILSPSFFRKQWPQYELDGLVTRELDESRKLVLPIWHKISAKEIKEFSPPLSNKVGVSTDKGVNSVCDAIIAASQQHLKVKAMRKELDLLYSWYHSAVYEAGADDGGGYDAMPSNESEIAKYKQQIFDLEQKLMPYFPNLGSR